MADAPYAPLVHAALLERVAAAKFPAVTYENHGMTLVLGESVCPKSSRTGELGGRWVLARRNRLTREQRDRLSWRWELLLKFDVQVSLEQFEDDLATDPPRVLRDDDHSHQVTLRLESATYLHPPQNQPSNGTHATFVFEAVPTPR